MYQSLPLFSFVLRSFLLYCAGDDLQYVRYSFSESAVLVGVLLMVFFAWNVAQSFEVAGDEA